MAIRDYIGTIKPAGLDVCQQTERSLPQEQRKVAAYCLLHFTLLFKHNRSTINTRRYDPAFGQTTGGGWICKRRIERAYISGTAKNDDSRLVFPYSPQKMPSIEPRMKSVGAAILEIQAGLCRGGVLAWDRGRGQKGI